jgi:hypothetical protein
MSSEPDFALRLERLKALGTTFWAKYGDGPLAERWPKQPERFAVESESERYGECFVEAMGHQDATLEIMSGDARRIVDLDTGKDVPFWVEVKVNWPADPSDA